VPRAQSGQHRRDANRIGNRRGRTVAAVRASVMAAAPDLWVFGYGSLMWRPGFDFEERTLATVRGYRRALCVYSHFHRGTPERPGLVLGLDRGGACKGVAFRVAADKADATIAYLRAREQVTMVYREIRLRARLADGRAVEALAYAVDRSHLQYAGALGLADLERFVLQGAGESGANPDYVRATYEHMLELGIADATLAALVRRLA
jgi:glutathione-specific gamma-glutamylcyclotransferase